MTDDDLRGTLVVVHPNLQDDPLGKQDQVGVICEANQANDDIYVDFIDKIGLYSSDALLVFLPVDEVHQNLAALNFNTEFDKLKTLTTIDLFMRYGSFEKRKSAMQLARDHKEIQHLCFDTLKNQIAPDISNNLSR